MLRVMFQKIFSKKWMLFCLSLGSILLIATVISFPLYQNAVFDGMLRDEFRRELQTTNMWPARISRQVTTERNTNGAAVKELEEFMEAIPSELGVETKETTRFYRVLRKRVKSTMGRDDAKTIEIVLGTLSNLGEHVEMLAGEMYSEDGLSEEGHIEVVINRQTMEEKGILVGEDLKFDSFKNSSGEHYVLRVVGVIEPDVSDFYWDIGTDELDGMCLMQESLFREMFLGESVQNNTVTASALYLFDFEKLRASDVEHILTVIENYDYKYNNFSHILEEFQTSEARITATLKILQIPMLVLLVAFLIMISSQMYEVERNEISVMKSRGSSRRQIFSLYIYQSVFVVMVSIVAGIPLGVVFLKMLGAASGFLEFAVQRNLDVNFYDNVWHYLLAGVVTAVVFMAVPALKHSKISIVHLKQAKVVKKMAWWEIFCVDIICLAVGIYGYYNFSRSEELVVKNVITETSLDPLLYFSASLFVVGLGLLFLRLQPLFARLIYAVGRGRWSPAAYASFLEIMRNSRKQQFILLFLILTVSLGTFHATVAQTILKNAVANTEYMSGADIVIKEQWKDNSAAALVDPDIVMRFYEPDFAKYQVVDAIETYTQVLYDDTTEETKHVGIMAFAGDKAIMVNYMGIQPKEFGEITWVDEECLEQHYYEYLNALAGQEKGLLISRNFAEDYGYKAGDMIKLGYTIIMVREPEKKEYFELEGKVAGIVDYWPGYKPVDIYQGENEELVEKQNYLIVGNMAAFEKKFKEKVQPYEVWIQLKEDAEATEISEWISSNDIEVDKYINGQTEVEYTIRNPLLQGTNGILTMEFIVMILLCAVGYLVYWVMSMRDREMLFGVLRAFGMHKGELIRMLVLEQLFSGVVTVFAGIGIGAITSRLFTPMMQAAYASGEQILPMQFGVDFMDMLRLYAAIAVVMIICLSVLVGFVFKLNMTKALKLGED